MSNCVPREMDADLLESEFQHYTQLCGPCVGIKENENVPGPQKELLMWHWKLGIEMCNI